MRKNIVYLIYSALISTWLVYQQSQGSILFEAGKRAARSQAFGYATHK